MPHAASDESAPRPAEEQAGDARADALPEDHLDRYSRLARRLFGVPIACVRLAEDEREWFAAHVSPLVDGSGDDETSGGPSSGVLVVEDLLREAGRARSTPLVAQHPDARFYAGFPLRDPRGEHYGTLYIVDRTPRSLRMQDLHALRDIGELASSEISARRLATTDELTGLANRRGLDELARHALKLCERCAQPVSVVVFDLDGFKEINDRHGHLVGDHCLQEFGRILIETFRESDIVARLGGDEFCAILVGTSASDAQLALARVENALARHNARDDSLCEVAFSAGIAGFSRERHGNLQEALREADLRMYEVKRRKRPA